jgi:hypothetical protein
VDTWEKPAADKLQDYKQQLEAYKQTTDYWRYQMYLDNFERKGHDLETTISPDMRTSANASPVSPSRLLPSRVEGEDEATGHERVDSRVLDWEEGLEGITPPVRAGIDEVRHVAIALGIHPGLMKFTTLPPEHMTAKAVQAFIRGTGSLLHLWEQNEAQDLVQSVYHPQSDTSPLNAIEVFAMSAVGSCCDDDQPVPGQEVFLRFFLQMLLLPLKMCDLRRMRLFACLAICRFSNSVESARRLMCKRLMFCGSCIYLD